MSGEPRCRTLPETLPLAIRAGAAAGVTRLADLTAFAVPGIPVWQAVRPAGRSLSVSQGKGSRVTAAMIGALLEATELDAAERLPRPESLAPLSTLAPDVRAIWAGLRDELAIDLDPALLRGWLMGTDLLSGRSCPMPWDLLSLDYTLEILEYPATSVGLACGNSRSEALAAGVAELLEHHALALFNRLRPHDRLAAQIALDTIDDPVIRLVLRRVSAAGFEVKAWSMAGEAGYPAILCTLFSRQALDDLPPAGGSGCHASARVAFLRALLEAVQSRAGLVAGARDDLSPDDYGEAGRRGAAILFRSLAFGDGELNWRQVGGIDCRTAEHCLEFLLGKAEEASALPVIAYDHAPPVPGLHLAHVLAPGLLDGVRRLARPVGQREALPIRVRTGERRVVFAGPSIAGLPVPKGVEVRPPAACGDLASLMDDPPAAVALIDGVFKSGPTVWHKEIAALLACGTQVIGGASLGALRAAELERFGMVGVGEIFRACRAGFLVRDDAVMLDHAPEELGYEPLSLPLVDAEYVLWCADLPPPALRMMQRIVRTTPFETRSWRSSREEYRRRTGEAFPLSLAALETAPSLKRMDAMLVLKAVAGARGRQHELPMPPLTSHFRALLARSTRASASVRS